MDLRGLKGKSYFPAHFMKRPGVSCRQGSLIDPGCSQALADFPFGALIQQGLAALGHIP